MEDWKKYGEGLQADVETAFEAALSKRHDDAVERERLDQQARDERAAWERKFLEDQVAACKYPTDDDREREITKLRRIYEKQYGSAWSFRFQSDEALKHRGTNVRH